MKLKRLKFVIWFFILIVRTAYLQSSFVTSGIFENKCTWVDAQTALQIFQNNVVLQPGGAHYSWSTAISCSQSGVNLVNNLPARVFTDLLITPAFVCDLWFPSIVLSLFSNQSFYITTNWTISTSSSSIYLAKTYLYLNTSSTQTWSYTTATSSPLVLASGTSVSDTIVNNTAFSTTNQLSAIDFVCENITTNQTSKCRMISKLAFQFYNQGSSTTTITISCISAQLNWINTAEILISQNESTPAASTTPVQTTESPTSQSATSTGTHEQSTTTAITNTTGTLDVTKSANDTIFENSSLIASNQKSLYESLGYSIGGLCFILILFAITGCCIVYFRKRRTKKGVGSTESLKQTAAEDDPLEEYNMEHVNPEQSNRKTIYSFDRSQEVQQEVQSIETGDKHPRNRFDSNVIKNNAVVFNNYIQPESTFGSLNNTNSQVTANYRISLNSNTIEEEEPTNTNLKKLFMNGFCTFPSIGNSVDNQLILSMRLILETEYPILQSEKKMRVLSKVVKLNEHHPYLVRFYGFTQLADSTKEYLVSERLDENLTFATFVNNPSTRAKLDSLDYLEWSRGLCSAVSMLHKKNITLNNFSFHNSLFIAAENIKGEMNKQTTTQTFERAADVIPKIYTACAIGLSPLQSTYESFFAPPEVSLDNSIIFDAAQQKRCDMWYFGLILWHLFDESPLPLQSDEYSLTHVRKMISMDFVIPSRPKKCLNDDYETFIKPCFHPDPAQRITSDELLKRFEAFFAEIDKTRHQDHFYNAEPYHQNEITPVESSFARKELDQLKHENHQILNSVRNSGTVVASRHYVSWPNNTELSSSSTSNSNSRPYANIPKHLLTVSNT